jgi:hypothetical protein
MNITDSMEAKISKLSPKLIRALDRYLDFLINTRIVKKQNKLRQDWTGGLKRVKMSAIELQKKSLEWRQ